ncbi:hypothetical protein EYC59_00320 [Candidatus Saccharibacteria bacterium]|nr:MAG: hypothetical protein EYC59_00320 [Candidatus Saccharibacteria bacterium]
MTKNAVIYVFGLSDHRARGQTLAVKTWRLYGVTPQVFHMYWHEPRPFADTLAKLLARIDELVGKGYAVSLVGTSAGASVAIAAYAARPATLHAVVCICGKLRNPETISPYTYRTNPAFRESMAQTATNLEKLNPEQRSRILSIRPVSDGLVPPADTVVSGAHHRRLYTRGHAFTIGYCVVLYAPFFLRFIKRLASRNESAS